MTRTSSLGKRISIDAMLLTFAIIISYVESIASAGIIFMYMPGFKLGFANIVIMIVFFNISKMDALAISMLRVLIVGILFSSPSSTMFSLFGAVFAYIFMLIINKLYDKHISFIGISVGCAALHNIGQLTAASLLFSDTSIFIYLPWLLMIAAITGVISGILTNFINIRIKHIIYAGVK